MDYSQLCWQSFHFSSDTKNGYTVPEVSGKKLNRTPLSHMHRLLCLYPSSPKACWILHDLEWRNFGDKETKREIYKPPAMLKTEAGFNPQFSWAARAHNAEEQRLHFPGWWGPICCIYITMSYSSCDAMLYEFNSPPQCKIRWKEGGFGLSKLPCLYCSTFSH